MRDEELWRRLQRLGEGGAEPAPEAIAAQRVAAVLIPLLADEPGCPVVFTRRAARLRRHAGEICLPGGRLEPADQGSVIRAALREAHEEIGLEPPQASVCRVLPACHNSRGDLIHPVLAPVARPARWRLQAEEVAGVIEVPLAHFLEAGHYRLERRRYDGQEKQSLVLDYGAQQIWGLTARIMHALREQWLAQTPA
ncbi:CoA pyrophosphatase [Pseudomonas balearica]|uniref:NUDIX hydrolase n=1 Tax=Stutzerimonas balearica TaxID=74829 RepID=UPI001F245076|nr:CoA pyrophosphatase [Stutzerimonas balearica]MCF6755787.1 CoA pyrophosphatase [Stutzerimonas balearica]